MSTSAADSPVGSERELDVVVYGASGFVGRLVAAYLAAHAPARTRIGLAGRSLDRLEQVRRDLGAGAASWPLVEADSGSPSTLADLARRTRVVATTVGPYARHGLPLVEACARAGTHYADLTGEVLFVRESIDRWDAMAASTGARIVHACGFDSVPSDLAVLLLHQAAQADDAGDLARTTLLARLRGGVSGGTIDSVRGQIAAMRTDAAARRLAADPYALSPDRAGEPGAVQPAAGRPAAGRPAAGRPAAGKRRSRGVRHDRRLDEWVGPFAMAPFNTRIVRRSNALQGWAYGRSLRYDEVMGFGRGPTSPLVAGVATAGVGLLALGLLTPGLRTVMDHLLPAPGEGPDATTRERGFFRMRTVTDTTQGHRYVATVAAQGDPGYAATSVMLGESALALALDDLPRAPAGVLTPATGIGAPLVDRLRRAGFELSVARAEGFG